MSKEIYTPPVPPEEDLKKQEIPLDSGSLENIEEQEPAVEIIEKKPEVLAETLRREPNETEKKQDSPWRARLRTTSMVGLALLAGVGGGKYLLNGNSGEKPQADGATISKAIEVESASASEKVDKQMAKEVAKQKAKPVKEVKEEIVQPAQGQPVQEHKEVKEEVPSTQEQKEVKEGLYEQILKSAEKTNQKGNAWMYSFDLRMNWKDGYAVKGEGHSWDSRNLVLSPVYGQELYNKATSEFNTETENLAKLLGEVATNPDITKEQRDVAAKMLSCLGKLKENQNSGVVIRGNAPTAVMAFHANFQVIRELGSVIQTTQSK